MSAQLENPFPGLRPFELTEHYLFFGRDGQSDELVTKLEQNRFVAVVGTSGSGKSSLVRAGLLPSLYSGSMERAGSHWKIAVFRPGDDPLGNLARALSAPGIFGPPQSKSESGSFIDIETTLRRSSLGLIEVVRLARMHSHENLLVVVDQFEELFRFRQTSATARQQDEAVAFVKLLLEAFQQRELPIYVVLTMRSDYLGECAQFRDLPEAINKSQYLIPRMTDDERREAITGPVAVSEAKISLPLVNRLLNDAGDNPDQLPILQHALMRTWDRWEQTRSDSEPLDIPHYEEIGGMDKALSLDADRAYDELSESRQKIAEKLFKCLTERGPDNQEIRRPTTVREICDVAEADEPEVVAVIEAFRSERRCFLMTHDNASINADTRIDISHESLIRGWVRLKEWVDEEALSARQYRKVADASVEYEQRLGELMTGATLQIALDWRERQKPNAAWAERYRPEFENAMAFLDESKAAREAAIVEREIQQREQVEREQKQRLTEERTTRLRRLVLGLAVLILVATGLATYAFNQRTNALSALLRADEERSKADMQTGLAQQARAIASEQADIAERQVAIARALNSELKDERDRADKEHARAEKEARAVGEERKKLLNRLATLYRDVFNSYSGRTEVTKKFEEILNIYRRANVRDGEVSTLMLVAEIYDGRNEEEEAVKYYEELLPLLENKDGFQKIMILGRLAAISEKSGNTQKTANYYDQLGEEYQRFRSEDEKGKAATFFEAASKIYVSLRQYQKALDSLNRALAVYKTLKSKESEASINEEIEKIRKLMNEKSN